MNDSAGHLVGDASLHMYRTYFVSCARTSDTVARWGGDEFMILLPDCPEQTAVNISKKINQQLLKYAFEHKDMYFDLNFSIGITLSKSGDTPASIISRADQASYHAKTSGDDVTLSSIN